MLKSRFGKGMNVADKNQLDEILDTVIENTGYIYGDVLEITCDEITNGDYSYALKYNAINRTSWFRKYVQTYLDIKGGAV